MDLHGLFTGIVLSLPSETEERRKDNKWIENKQKCPL
jgi:hypothetical protein